MYQVISGHFLSWAFTAAISVKTFVAGTLFIEAEDADFGHGKYVKDKKIGMNGAYPGGAYEGLGTLDDEGFDWHLTGGPDGQAYRPDTKLSAGKKDGSAGSDRGLFQVTTWWTLGWNDGGEWHNYTRDFPTPAKDYEVYGHLSSGGAAINIRLDQVVSGQGKADTAQVKQPLGYFTPKRATAGWDTLEIFRLTDIDGNPITVNLGGNVTLRTTILAGSNSDQDYFAFVPATAAPPAGKRSYSIGLNFGSDESAASLAATDSAGVIKQPNWNNLRLTAGSTNNLVADMVTGTEATTASVTWSAPNTWANTGPRGEENNKFTGADKILMTGYLDTGAATTTSITISNIPPKLTSSGYDVYVYALGGVGGKGGGYRIMQAGTTNVLKDYVKTVAPTNSTDYVRVPTNLGGTNYGVGNYIVFTGLTDPNIVVQGVTANGLGIGSGPRAPINAIQLVAPTTGGPQDITRPGDVIISTSSDPTKSPNGERVPNAIDNQAATKYLNFEKLNTGFTITPSVGSSIVAGIGLTSANDAPERDPASYKIEGSTDGKTFTTISEGPVAAFSGRFVRQEILFSNKVAYTSYRVTFPTVANATAANSMQIAEVELLGTIIGGGLAPKLTIGLSAGKLTISWTAGKLQEASAVTGPYTDVSNAASPLSITPAGTKFYRAVGP